MIINEREYTLAQYASMLNIKLLRPSDFNKQLRERGVEKKVTVQKISKACGHERQVRDTLEWIWRSPGQAISILNTCLDTNRDMFEFEKSLTL